MERPRRTVEEIIQLHRRERSLQKEVFVEGLEDKYFYQAFLASQSLSQVAVLEISSVEIPYAHVHRLGLSEGNKGRVVALASLLEGRLAINEVVCIADADSDHFLTRVYNYSLLLLTDYTSIELHIFNNRVMSRLLSVGLSGFPKDANEVISDLRGPLEEAFLVRVAGEALGLVTQETKHSSFCKFDRKRRTIEFQACEYTSNLFKPTQDKSWRKKLGRLLIELRGRRKSDVRLQIRGHDFRETFGWYIRQHPGFGGLNADTIARMLLGFVDFRDLATERLFLELVRRLGL